MFNFFRSEYGILIDLDAIAYVRPRCGGERPPGVPVLPYFTTDFGARVEISDEDYDYLKSLSSSKKDQEEARDLFRKAMEEVKNMPAPPIAPAVAVQ